MRSSSQSARDALGRQSGDMSRGRTGSRGGRRDRAGSRVVRRPLGNCHCNHFEPALGCWVHCDWERTAEESDLARLSVPACLVFLLLGITAAQSAPLATFTVVSTTDAAQGFVRRSSTRTPRPERTRSPSISQTAPPHRSRWPTPLPTISDPVTIDGTTQAGFAGAPIIEINAAGIGSSDGLAISGGNSTVRGLVINRVPLGGERSGSSRTVETPFRATTSARTSRAPYDSATTEESSCSARRTSSAGIRPQREM